MASGWPADAGADAPCCGGARRGAVSRRGPSRAATRCQRASTPARARKRRAQHKVAREAAAAAPPPARGGGPGCPSPRTGRCCPPARPSGAEPQRRCQAAPRRPGSAHAPLPPAPAPAPAAGPCAQAPGRGRAGTRPLLPARARPRPRPWARGGAAPGKITDITGRLWCWAGGVVWARRLNPLGKQLVPKPTSCQHRPPKHSA